MLLSDRCDSYSTTKLRLVPARLIKHTNCMKTLLVSNARAFGSVFMMIRISLKKKISSVSTAQDFVYFSAYGALATIVSVKGAIVNSNSLFLKVFFADSLFQKRIQYLKELFQKWFFISEIN